jgi:hypothetical protein
MPSIIRNEKIVEKRRIVLKSTGLLKETSDQVLDGELPIGYNRRIEVQREEKSDRDW